MTIACLGWGSLIWQPEDLPVRGEWRTDGPKLPLEFARLSGGGRVTLVISKDALPCQVQWCELNVTSLDHAVEQLRVREGNTRRSWIGCWPSDDTFEHNSTIETWARSKGVSSVVWTAIPPKWNDQNGVIPSEHDVLKYLKSLPPDQQVEPFRYIKLAPEQIRTRYRPVLRELIASLEEASSKHRQ